MGLRFSIQADALLRAAALAWGEQPSCGYFSALCSPCNTCKRRTLGNVLEAVSGNQRLPQCPVYISFCKIHKAKTLGISVHESLQGEAFCSLLVIVFEWGGGGLQNGYIWAFYTSMHFLRGCPKCLNVRQFLPEPD